MQQWRPQSTGNQAVDRQLSTMADMINTALSQVQALSGSQAKPAVAQSFTPAQISFLRSALQANGSFPLDLTALPGVTGSAQIAGIPILSALPTGGDPGFINTAAVVVGGQLFVNNNGTFAGTTVGLTSVALAMPAEFTVSGSPLIANGTITVTRAAESANLVWAGPVTGAPAVPGFRSLVVADLPANLSGLGTAKISAGNGSPETVVTGNVGDLFLRQNGGAGTTLYVKESGSGNTGWIPK